MNLCPPESVAEQRARLAREADQLRRQAGRELLAERLARPLTGTRGDLGQGDLLGAGDLFSAPSPSLPPSEFRLPN